VAILERVRKCDGVTVFLIDFRDQKGRRVRELAGTTRKQAKDLYAKRLGEVKSGTYVNPRDVGEDRGPTFAKFCERFLAEHPGQRRSNHYPAMVKRLLPYFEGKHVREITRADLDRLRIRLQTDKVKRIRRPLSNTSVLKLLRTVHRIFKQAVRWGVIDYNPAADLEKPSVPMRKTRYLTREELRRLDEQAPPWLKPMLTLAVATGMRLKEVTKLRWDEVDKAAGVLHVSEETKTGSRAIPLNATALTVIDGQVRHVRSPYVFTTATGDNYDNDEARGRISKATIATMKAAAIERASFHTLRHTAASLMVQAGVPLYEVQKVLGHSTPIMTERYAHLAPQHLRGAIDALDRALTAPASPESRTTNVSTPASTNAVDTQVDTAGSTRSAGTKRNRAKSL
jgi:integrase